MFMCICVLYMGYTYCANCFFRHIFFSSPVPETDPNFAVYVHNAYYYYYNTSVRLYNTIRPREPHVCLNNHNNNNNNNNIMYHNRGVSDSRTNARA